MRMGIIDKGQGLDLYRPLTSSTVPSEGHRYTECTHSVCLQTFSKRCLEDSDSQG